jgi:type IV secretory pathway VirB2 component (pilin)
MTDTIPIQPAERGYSRAMVGLLVFYSLVGISPVWHAMGIQPRHLMLLPVAGVLALSYVHRRSLVAWTIPVMLILFGSAFAAGVYWGEPRLTLYPMFFILSSLLLAQSTPREISRYVDVASWVMLVLVVGGVIGLMLAAAGVTPLFSFPNPDGRSNFFFYTTLTNAYWSGWIQASGIYDEPGAFSFMICAVAFMRHVTGRGYRLTWTLLGLGLVTFSLAHLVFMAVFALAERISLRRVAFVILGVVLLLGAARVVGLHQTYQQYLFARVTLDAAQQRGFQGRIQLAQNAVHALTTVDRAVMFGVDSDCTVDYASCRQKWLYMAENPFGPLAHHGLLLAWPYYLFLALGVGFLLAGRRNLAFLALTLLFLQRPFVMSFGYSFMAVAPLWLQVRFMTASRRRRPAPGAGGTGILEPAMADR